MRRLAPSLRGLAVAFLGAVVTFVVPVKADDVFWHLAVGERILTTGAIPRTNTFSFTAPEAPWLAHEWLSEVLFAWVHRLGPAALGLLGLGLEVAAFALLTALAWRGTRSPVASALLSLFAGLLWLANWSLRPYLFGNLLLLATLWLVDTAPGRARSLALAGLFALWANLHGSWLLGLGVLGAWALGATLRGEPTWRRRWGELLISTVATTLTPHHVHGLLFPFRYLESSVLEGPSFLAEIVEWQRVSPASPLGALLVVVVTLAIGLVAASRQRPRLERSLVFLAFALAAFSAVRHVALLGAALVALLPPHLAELTRRARGILRRALTAGAEVDASASSLVPVAAWAMAAWAVATPWSRPAEFFPSELLHHLSSHRAPRRLFHAFNWGGALLYAGEPVFIDQRNDCYPPEVWRDYLEVHHLREGWEAVLDRWHIDAVASPNDERLAERLRASPRWLVEHQDAHAVLFSRRPEAASRSPPLKVGP